MKKKNIIRDVPLSEITLRRYEKPAGLGDRHLLRKLCLSVGLLQPGDSRDVIVDVFSVLLKAASNKTLMSSTDIREEVVQLRKKYNLPLKGVADSNIRRQLKRLRGLFLVEKISNDYRISEWEHPSVIFQEKIEKFYLDNIKQRVKDYFDAIDFKK